MAKYQTGNKKRLPKKKRPRCRSNDKVRYPTQRVANKALDTLWRAAIQGRLKGEKIPCRCYACTRCRGWHLTSQKIREADEAV